MSQDDGLKGCRNCHDGYIFVRKGTYGYVFRCSTCHIIPENGINESNRMSLLSKGYKLDWIHQQSYKPNIPQNILLAKSGIGDEVPF